MPLKVQNAVPLAPLTTLGLGGAARYFVEATAEGDVLDALAWAADRDIDAHVLGGGSNTLVPDAGIDGLVVRVATRGLTFLPAGNLVLCEAQAGEPWDGVVTAAIDRNLAGLECLSGIPGNAGATPIQNVGAYGQEVADTLRSVRAWDRRRRRVITLAPADCAFAYRDSVFKREPQRHVVLSATFALRPGGAPTIRYAELAAAVSATPSLAETREAVLALRRLKSMVLDVADPNGRSVGSFFTNPVMTAADADAVVARAVRDGHAERAEEVPRYPAGPGRTKLSAAWLIERAGFAKGTRRGNVGISSRHALALVHHGGGSTAELLAFAREVRDAVRTRFGVWLTPEPVILGGGGGDVLGGGGPSP